MRWRSLICKWKIFLYVFGQLFSTFLKCLSFHHFTFDKVIFFTCLSGIPWESYYIVHPPSYKISILFQMSFRRKASLQSDPEIWNICLTNTDIKERLFLTQLIKEIMICLPIYPQKFYIFARYFVLSLLSTNNTGIAWSIARDNSK